MKRILIIGATSSVASNVARKYAANGDKLYLLGRSEEKP
jgi:short-subunit dehydrogenase